MIMVNQNKFKIFICDSRLKIQFVHFLVWFIVMLRSYNIKCKIEHLAESFLLIRLSMLTAKDEVMKNKRT